MVDGLSKLAQDAKAGCTHSLWEIRRRFIPMVVGLSEKYWYRIRDQGSFEESCYVRIDEAIRKFDPNKGSFEWQVTFRIKNLLYQHMSRFKKIRPSTVYINEDYGEEKSIALDIPDGLAAVEDIVISNELKKKVALLAEGDSRKIFVLKAWTLGYTNDSEIASLLAQRFGGKADSYRKYIARFRTTCRQALISDAA